MFASKSANWFWHRGIKMDFICQQYYETKASPITKKNFKKLNFVSLPINKKELSDGLTQLSYYY